MTIKFKIVDKFTPMLKKQKKQFDQILSKAFPVWKKNTPKKTGNALRHTKIIGNSYNDRIEADYPYAKALDDGASKQSPDGMSKPTQEFIEKEFKRITR